MMGTPRPRSTSATGKTTAPPTFTSRIAASRGAWDARRSASSIFAAAAEVEDHLLDEHRDNGLPITGEWPSNRAAPDELIDSGDRELLYCRSPGSLGCRLRDTASTMARSRLVTAFTLGALQDASVPFQISRRGSAREKTSNWLRRLNSSTAPMA